MININDANADVLWENEKTENFLSVFKNASYSKIETPKFVPGAENLTLLGDSFNPDNHYNRSIDRSINNDLYGHSNYVSGLHVVNPLIPSTIDRDYTCSPRFRRIQSALKESEYQFHTNGNSFCGDKLTQVSNPVTNTLTEYYSKKQKYAATRKNQNYSDLLSLASSDSVIRMLEKNADMDNKGACIKANTECISDLSQQWRAKKRQNDDLRDSSMYHDGKEINPLDIMFMNVPNNDIASDCIKIIRRHGDTDTVVTDTAIKTKKSISPDCKKILKKHDVIYETILDLFLQGFTQLEIAEKIGKTMKTVNRLFAKLTEILAPITDDLIDYIRLQSTAPSYAWSASHKVNLPKQDRVTTTATLPGITFDMSHTDKNLQWFFSVKRDIAKIS